MTEARDVLHRLAHAYGIQTSYRGHDGLERQVSGDTLAAVLTALGCPVAPDGLAGLESALEHRRLAPWRRVLPHTTVCRAGSGSSVQVHLRHGSRVTVDALLEDGSVWPLEQLEDFTEPQEVSGELVGQATFRLPHDLPLGWHLLRARLEEGHPEGERGVEATLVVVPDRLDTAESFHEHRGWGLSVQLYSARSAASWSLGDLHDLADLAVQTAAHGGDFVLSNPLHASAPQPPVVSSPYSPSTRRFTHPMYLRIEDLPEYADAGPDLRAKVDGLAAGRRADNTAADSLDRDAAYADKLTALRWLHGVPRSPGRDKTYRAYRDQEGQGLDDFALWCALRSHLPADDPAWRDPELVPGGQTAERYRREMAEEVDLHRWTQWLCDEQLAAAQSTARGAGMRLGLMQDLAVGADRNNADAWMLQDLLVSSMSVGAPPDMYNQVGQDWSQSPWHPERLAETGYRAYRDMLRSMLRRAGGLRVDHILGMFRLWWVPVGQSPLHGAYVGYDHEAMIGILALEAHRAGAVVVGEDLGTFEPWVQDYLAQRGLLGTSILWFEQHDGAPRPPQQYRRQCLTSVNTHDLPPTAGYLTGLHVDLRERLGLLNDPVGERQRAADEREAYLRALQEAGFYPAGAEPDLSDPAERADVVVALHRYLAQAPSLLHCVALVDAVGELRIQNQPGTQQHEYPNWEVPLADAAGRPVLIDDLDAVPGFARLLDAVDRELDPGAPGGPETPAP
ncbi:4-alpha-glucanotransferase [Citricoccus sp. I39-566]|uniref:4-alpha-glucanotransferase n=1 Tax=Citricoccus sp. I39-566 TaxID=3073268 RepID=UPI00286C803A|nr:4-alpha-glucanotransferase [Citricoccus sp. I39-566]WMY77357.1 4-alpha-glucanotransferase [Citricoccus sp. I39-566]